MSPRHWLVVAAVAVAAAVALVVALNQSGSATSSAKPLTGTNFATLRPNGYRLAITHPVAGVTIYQLTSPASTQVPQYIQGPPPAGVIDISIQTLPLALAEVRDPVAATQTPLQLFANAVTEPSGSTEIVPSVAAHATTLNPLPAAAGSFSYADNGVQNVQSDVVARNGLTIYGVELDTAPALVAQGTSAMNTILSNWEWIGSSP
jgi:hypothetical protein